MKLWPIVLILLVGFYLIDSQVYGGQYFGALKSILEQIWQGIA